MISNQLHIHKKSQLYKYSLIQYYHYSIITGFLQVSSS